MDKNNLEEISLVKVEKENIFTKIKKFFIGLLKKNKNKHKEVDSEIFDKVNNFKDKLIIPENEEENRIIKLQEDYCNENVLIEDISDEDFEKLCNLYEEQISDLKKLTEELNKSTESYKNKILQIRKNLKLEGD